MLFTKTLSLLTRSLAPGISNTFSSHSLYKGFCNYSGAVCTGLKVLATGYLTLQNTVIVNKLRFDSRDKILSLYRMRCVCHMTLYESKFSSPSHL
jgi:hypothetical protein